MLQQLLEVLSCKGHHVGGLLPQHFPRQPLQQVPEAGGHPHVGVGVGDGHGRFFRTPCSRTARDQPQSTVSRDTEQRRDSNPRTSGYGEPEPPLGGETRPARRARARPLLSARARSRPGRSERAGVVSVPLPPCVPPPFPRCAPAPPPAAPQPSAPRSRPFPSASPVRPAPGRAGASGRGADAVAWQPLPPQGRCVHRPHPRAGPA